MKKIMIMSKDYQSRNSFVQQGITLIALVVTIVVLLILLGITINMLFGNDGIFNIANKAREQHEIGALKDRINNVIADWSIERLTKPGITVDNLWDKMVDEDIISKPVEDYVEGPEKEEENDVYQVTTNEGYVVEVIVSPDGNVTIGDAVKGDKLPPKIVEIKSTVGTNNIHIEVTMSRWENGTISYYYKKDGETDKSYKPLKENTTELTADLTGLEQNIVYNIKIVAKNENGSTEKEINERTGKLKEGTITQKGETVWSNGTAQVELETSETGVSIEYQIDGMEGQWKNYEGPITGLNHNQTIYAVITDGNNQSGYTSIDILDEKGPTVTVAEENKTSNSITVNVSSGDAEWGMPETPTYSYYIKKTTDESYLVQAEHTGTETSYTFTGLLQNTSYDVKIITQDKAGNTGEGEEKGIITETVGGASENLQEGNIIASSPTWDNGTASITLSKGTGVASNLSIEYQIGEITEGKWTVGTNVTGLNHNNEVHARLTDGTNVGNYASVTVLDNKGPIVTVTKGTVTTNSIQVNVNSRDEEWGMPTSITYSYYIKKASEGTYPTTASYTGTNTSNTFNNLIQGTNYDVKVITQDKAGNTGEGEQRAIPTGTVGGATGNLQEGNIIASSPTWSGGKASITLSKGTGVASNLSIQYQIGGVAEGNWTTGTSVTGLSHNTTVYARLTDGINAGSYASVEIKDTIAPSIPTINTNGYVSDTWTKNNITLSFNSVDNEVGVWKYQWTPDGINIYDVSNPYVWTTDTRTGFYVRAVDYAGNCSNWGGGIILAKDTTGPTITNYWYSAINGDTVSIYVQVSDGGSGINRVQCPTSTAVGGYNDWNWLPTVWDAGANAYRADIKASDYNKYETYYRTHIYVYDNLDNYSMIGLNGQEKYLGYPTNSVRNVLKAGNYVTYPSSRGNLTCRVLYDNSSGYGVQIITSDVVQGSSVMLGSDYGWAEAINSYDNAISTLNNAANAYNNSTYSSRARCVGSHPTDTTDNPGYYTSDKDYMSSYNGQFKNTDTNYLIDYNQMVALGIVECSNYYWLASRYVSSGVHARSFSVRRVNRDDRAGHSPLFSIGDGFSYWQQFYDPSSLMRPVFVLNPGIKVTGGNGSLDSPYTLGT